MIFAIVFLLGIFIPFLFIKNAGWTKWLPCILFFFLTILIALKILFFPAPEMAVLGEVVYLLITACAFTGSLLSALFIHIF